MVLETPLPGWTAPELLVEIRRLAPDATILVRLPEACPADAARLARLGADTVLAPGDDLPRHLDRALRERDSAGRALPPEPARAKNGNGF